LEGAAFLGDEERVSAFLDAQPGTEALSMALAGAAKGGHLDLCRRLLDSGALINGKTGRDQNTPLMLALSAPSHAVTEMLLARGADVTATNRYGTLALHFAVGYGASLETIRLVLNAGASAHVATKNKNGRSPLDVAAACGREDATALLLEFQTRI
jgi:ankyrin repeat protein